MTLLKMNISWAWEISQMKLRICHQLRARETQSIVVLESTMVLEKKGTELDLDLNRHVKQEEPSATESTMIPEKEGTEPDLNLNRHVKQEEPSDTEFVYRPVKVEPPEELDPATYVNEKWPQVKVELDETAVKKEFNEEMTIDECRFGLEEEPKERLHFSSKDNERTLAVYAPDKTALSMSLTETCSVLTGSETVVERDLFDNRNCNEMNVTLYQLPVNDHTAHTLDDIHVPTYSSGYAPMNHHAMDYCTTTTFCHQVQDLRLSVSHSVSKDEKCELKDDKCLESGKSFTEKRTSSLHATVYSGEKEFKCKECGRRFAQWGGLKKHAKIHLGIKKFKCDQCGKLFRTSSFLNRHYNIHTGDKKYVCEACGEVYTTYSSLSSHSRLHRNYKCEECGHLALTLYRLKRHLQIHTGFKGFRCDECERYFVLKQSLDLHLKCHTGERDFQCEECGKAFTHHMILKKHTEVHSAKNYQCEICGKLFRTKFYLRKHIFAHTRTKNDECEESGRIFGLNNSLKTH